MSLAEAIETTRIHRVAGLTGARTALVTTRPCRAPHHTISDVGLSGGGYLPTPGEVSLAHHGILVLNERPDYGRYSLEVLLQPLAKGLIAMPSLGRHCPCPSLHPTSAAPYAEEFAAVAGGRDLGTGHPATLGSGRAFLE